LATATSIDWSVGVQPERKSPSVDDFMYIKHLNYFYFFERGRIFLEASICSQIHAMTMATALKCITTWKPSRHPGGIRIRDLINMESYAVTTVPTTPPWPWTILFEIVFYVKHSYYFIRNCVLIKNYWTILFEIVF
jgi:hypothetical protein